MALRIYLKNICTQLDFVELLVSFTPHATVRSRLRLGRDAIDILAQFDEKNTKVIECFELSSLNVVNFSQKSQK